MNKSIVTSNTSTGEIEDVILPDIKMDINKVTKNVDLSVSDSIDHFEGIPFNQWQGRYYCMGIKQVHMIKDEANRVLAILEGNSLPNQNKFKEANATFGYRVGDKSDKVNVGAKSASPKSVDDWKVSLALQAGQEIADKLSTEIQSVSLSLKTFAVK